MLFALNFPRQRFNRFPFVDGDRCLADDWTVVGLFIDDVNGAAGDLRPVIERLLRCMEPGEGGEEGWVHVEDPLREGREQRRPN